MPTSTNVTNLKINTLTEAQYDAAVQGGVIGENELSILTDLDEAVQVSTMPTADTTQDGKIVQYIGATDSNYTNGYFYKCSGTGSPVVYSWAQVDVQPAADPLPSQSGNSGKFLTTDGSSTSWGDALVNKRLSGQTNDLVIGDNASGNGANEGTVAIGQSAQSGSRGVAVGRNANAGSRGTAIGANAKTTSSYATAIGESAQALAQNAIQLGVGLSGQAVSNSDASTFKVGNDNGNFEMMSANGTIPTDRFTTTPVADGTYTPTLSIASGVATRTWAPAASAPVVPSTTPQLLAANWSSNTQTITVSGVTASNVVFVSPAPASSSDYASAGILCTAQATDSLTFTCTTTPSNDISLSVVILG